jgi:hypothetical protein
MQIIIGIRRFLKLDKKTFLTNYDLIDAVGLGILDSIYRKTENDSFMGCLINHKISLNSKEQFIPNNFNFDNIHQNIEFHF